MTIELRSSRASGLISQNRLVVMLTLVTGATDAMAFEKLGNVFTSVMTGNMVLLGLTLGKGEVTPAIHVAAALLAFMIGTMDGARIAGHPDPGDGPWPLRLTFALCCEWILFFGFATLWELRIGGASGALEVGMLMVCAVALGIQSSAILRLGLSGLSTTYLTGTLTTVFHAIAHGNFSRDTFHRLAILVALIFGAVLGGALAFKQPRSAPCVQLVILACVIASGEILNRRTRPQLENGPRQS
jgi:uncharacterized membrane protein YoaK (UPF0700 family)